MQRLDRYLVGIVVAHLAVTVVHAVSHLVLQILPSGLDLGFIIAVIMIGPVVGLFILRFNRALAGGFIAILLAASFVYGFYGHFVVAGPDNVPLLASEPWTVVFVVTAALIGLLEVIGSVIAMAVFWAAARSLSEPAGPPA